MTDIAPSPAHRRARSFEINPLSGAAFLVFATFFVIMASYLWYSFPSDLSALYMAGYFYAHDAWGMIYDYPPGFFGSFPPSWEAATVQMGFEAGDTFPYVYPPLWAALVAPLTEILDIQGFFRLFILINLSMLGLGILLAHRLCQSLAIPLWLWTLIATALFATSIIAQTAIWHLQPQIIVVVLTLWSFERYAAGKPIAAGVILAFAGGLKIAPAAFGVIFLLDRNWRAAIAAALTGAVLLALSFLVGGLQLHLDFLEGAAAASEGIFFTRITYTVEMALYALGMWAGYLPFVDTSDAVERIMHTPPAISVAVKALALAAFGWVIWRTYRLPADIRLPAQIILLTLIINGFGPLGWSHYYLPIILFLPALFGLMSRTSGITLAILFAVVTSSPAQLWMREHWVNETVVGVVHTGLMALIFVALILSLKRHEPPLSA